MNLNGTNVNLRPHVTEESIQKIKQNNETKKLINQAIKKANEAIVNSTAGKFPKKAPSDVSVKQIKQNKAIKELISDAVKKLNDSLNKVSIVQKPSNSRKNIGSRESPLSDKIEMMLKETEQPITPILETSKAKNAFIFIFG